MDITRLKQAGAEAQLHREELAHLSRVATVSALSGSLAHELSQPLSSILMNAEAGHRLMSQDAPDLVEIRAIFADIVSADRRAREIIERLRTMLRRGEVALQPVSVTRVSKSCSASPAAISLRAVSPFRISPPATFPRPLTDRVQLQQILLNLIMNACDAMESNPPEDRKLTLMAFVAQDEMRIGVLDCGVGLPDDIETLFQPFHTTKESGLGMGLSICRTLVTSLGGRLWAERRAERGAAFYVALPLAKEARHRLEPENPVATARPPHFRSAPRRSCRGGGRRTGLARPARHRRSVRAERRPAPPIRRRRVRRARDRCRSRRLYRCPRCGTRRRARDSA